MTTKKYGVLCAIDEDDSGTALDIWDTESEKSESFYISGAIEQRLLENANVYGTPVSYCVDRFGMVYDVEHAPYNSWPANLQKSADFKMWQDHYAKPAFAPVGP
ncbi:MAG: hypothetical protein GC136_00195 [Alphaproteobacteria bacterium]|nr:hypothetical protein [Alphaproteobacteria bacterium]